MSNKKDKVKFKDRKIVQWAKENAPDLIGNSLEFIGDVTGIEMVENLGKKIAGSNELTPEQKAEALEVVKLDLEFEKQISERWVSDMTSDSWLSKNVRPLILLYSWVLVTLITVAAWLTLGLPQSYVYLIETLCVSVNVAYFGSRTIEKYQSIKKK
jgi:hypothetical protein